MHHIKVIKDGNVNNVVKEQLVDGVQYVDDEPREGSLNGITSGAVAKVAGDVGDVKAIIPEGTTEENPLVNETGLGEVAERVTTAEGDIDAIEEKIPSGASSSNKLVTESDLEAAQDSWQSGFTPKGEATVSQIDALTTQSNGDQYIVTDSGTITAGNLAVVAGDTVAWNATDEVWYKVNQYATTTYAQNVARSIAPEFVPNETNAVAGMPYMYGGTLYVAKEVYQGPWDASKFAIVNMYQYLNEANAVQEASRVGIFQQIDDTYRFGYTVDVNVGVGNAVDLSGDASTSTWCSRVVPCKNGDVFKVSGLGGSDARLWAFVDVDGKLVSLSDSSVDSQSLIILYAPCDGYFVTNSQTVAYRHLYQQDNSNDLYHDIIQEGHEIYSCYVDYGADVYDEPAIIQCSGNVGDTLSSLTPTTSVGWKCAVVNCRKGDVFVVSGQSGNNAKLWCFIDSSNKIVLNEKVYGTVPSKIIVAPADGKLIYNTRTDVTSSFKYRISSSDLLAKIKTNADNLSQYELRDSYYKSLNSQLNKGIVINCAGNIGDTIDMTPSRNPPWVCTVLEVSTGDKIRLSGRGGSSARLWAFVDVNSKLVSVASSSLNQTTPLDLISPCNGYLIYNSNYVNAEDYTNLSKIQYAQEYVGDIESAINNTPIAVIGVDMNCVDVSGDLSRFTIAPTSENNPIWGQVYDAFDELLSNYPNFVSRVDAAAEVGIAYPAYFEGEKLYLYKLSNYNQYVNDTIAKKKILIFGGIHGAEMAAPVNLYNFAKRLCTDGIVADDNLFKLVSAFDIYILPYVNYYGARNYKRVNANGVDINRNFPTSQWSVSGAGTYNYTGPSAGSEFETQVLMALVESIEADIVIDHHNYWELARQFYMTPCQEAMYPYVYRLLTECSFSFKKAYPEYFGSDFSLLIDSSSDMLDIESVPQGVFALWMHEKHVKCGGTLEVGADINYYGGELESNGRGRYSAASFSLAEFTLRSYLCEFANLVYKKVFEE